MRIPRHFVINGRYAFLFLFLFFFFLNDCFKLDRRLDQTFFPETFQRCNSIQHRPSPTPNRSKIGLYWAELLEAYCAGFPNVFSFSLLCLRQRNIKWFQNDINRIKEIDTCVSGLDISIYQMPGEYSSNFLVGVSSPDPISDQKMSFSTPAFRPDL